MANKMFNKNAMTLEVDTVTLFGQAVIGASGAVESFSGGGIASIAKVTGDGKYTITLSDKYNRVLEVDAKVYGATISPASSVQLLSTPATIHGSNVFTIQCVSGAGAAVNPASGEAIMIKLALRNSSVGPYDK